MKMNTCSDGIESGSFTGNSAWLERAETRKYTQARTNRSIKSLAAYRSQGRGFAVAEDVAWAALGVASLLMLALSLNF